jgi:hypothetical protein
MTDRIAVWFGGLLIAVILLDVLVFGTEHLLFLSKKLAELIEWLAFWR